MLTEVNSPKEYFETLADKRFNPAAAKGINEVFQWKITGEGGGRWHAILENGKLAVHEGGHPSAAVELEMAGDKYVDMVNGKLNGQKAFMTRQLKVHGDQALARRMQRIFPIYTASRQAVEVSKINRPVGSTRTPADIIEEYADRMTKGDFTALNDFVSSNSVNHTLPTILLKEFKNVNMASTQQSQQAFFEQVKHAFSDRTFTFNRIEPLHEDEVVINYTIRGIHDKHHFFSVAPTGQEVHIDGTAILRFKNGKIIDYWGAPSCSTCTGLVNVPHAKKQIKKVQKRPKAIPSQEPASEPQNELSIGSARSLVDIMHEYARRMTAGDRTALDDFTLPEWLTHASPPIVLEQFSDVISTQDGERIFFENVEQAFSNRTFTFNRLEQLNENEVVINYTIRGFHDQGYFFSVAPTGEEESINGTAILHFKDGKMEEHWGGPTCPAGVGLVNVEESKTKKWARSKS